MAGTKRCLKHCKVTTVCRGSSTDLYDGLVLSMELPLRGQCGPIYPYSGPLETFSNVSEGTAYGSTQRIRVEKKV